MAQISENRSFIVSLVKMPELNKQGKMRQGIKILTNQGEKWLNITTEPWLSPQTKNQSVNFEVWLYNDRLYGKLAGASPTAGLPASQGIPQDQEALPQAAGAAKAPWTGQYPDKTTRLSIERQSSWCGACDACPVANADEATRIRIAQQGAYFISTGLSSIDTEQIDQEEKLAAAELVEERPIYDSDEPPDNEQPVPF